jgi:hypothetical protein
MPKTFYNIGHNVAPEASFMIIICLYRAYRRGRISMVDLFIKIVVFIKKEVYKFSLKST